MENLTNSNEKSFNIIETIKEAWELTRTKGVKQGIWKIIGISALIGFLLTIVLVVVTIVLAYFIKNQFIGMPFSILTYSIITLVQLSFAAIILKSSINVLRNKDDSVKNYSSFYNLNYKLNWNIIIPFLFIMVGLNILTNSLSFIPSGPFSRVNPQSPGEILHFLPIFLPLILFYILIYPFLIGIVFPFSLINAYEKNAKNYRETFEIIKNTFIITIKHFFHYLLLYIWGIILFAASFLAFAIFPIVSSFIGSSPITGAITIIFGLIYLIIMLTYIVPYMSCIFAVAYTKENFDK